MGLRRDIVLAPPSEDDIKILGPQMPKQEGTIELTSQEMAEEFNTMKSVFGFNAAVSVAAKAGGMGVGAGVSGSHNKQKQMEAKQVGCRYSLQAKMVQLSQV